DLGRGRSVRGLAKGWAPTLIGYSLQGLGKFGFYEVFKNVYGNMMGEENAFLYRTSLYLAASASAEFFADMLLAPMRPPRCASRPQAGYAKNLREPSPRCWRREGATTFYKACRRCGASKPCTSTLLPKRETSATKPSSLTVTFVAGYIAGVFCAIVSHPRDTMVSKAQPDAEAGLVGVGKALGWKVTPSTLTSANSHSGSFKAPRLITSSSWALEAAQTLAPHRGINFLLIRIATRSIFDSLRAQQRSTSRSSRQMHLLQVQRGSSAGTGMFSTS
uniref:Phosphate carrier protein, mitochondrial n=1 Tax=Macrostomum lignano TaxID=282301 RepID=A0A1I8FC91_9PLAT